MNFEPQCKTRADLYREMARVLDMCEAAGFDRPCDCVNLENEVYSEFSSSFPALDSTPTDYEFAIAIVKGRPVFRGDVLHGQRGAYTVLEDGNAYLNADKHSHCVRTKALTGWFSWNPRTIDVNGVEVWVIGFKNEKDREAFKAAMEGKKSC